jgi:hypothetical protein
MAQVETAMVDRAATFRVGADAFFNLEERMWAPPDQGIELQ